MSESPQARGHLLEEVVAEVFSTVPGVAVRARNVKSVFANEEFDLVITNRAATDGLPMVGPYFSVECKNWSGPVGSTEVSWFATKLRRSSQSFGVLVAAHGVTGRASEMTAAHFEAATALTEGQAVVVLTLKELAWLTSGEELADLLAEKHAWLVARRGLLLVEDRPRRSPRDILLAQLAESVKRSADLIRSVAVTVGSFRTTLDAFLASEYLEAEADAGDQAIFNRWTEENMIAFETLADALRRVGRACISQLRSQPGADWPLEQLAVGLDSRPSESREAPPDSPLAKELIDHWTHAIEFGVSYERDAAVLSLLGWSIEWLLVMSAGNWPPPWV